MKLIQSISQHQLDVLRRIASGRFLRLHMATLRRFTVCIGILAIMPMLIPIASAQGEQLTRSQAQNNAEGVLHTRASIVVLQATVRNSHNNLVAGLAIQDFSLYEDGVLQKIKRFSHEDTPVALGLVIDSSGSMRNKREAVIAAALDLARSSNDLDELFVVHFNEKTYYAMSTDKIYAKNIEKLGFALSRMKPDGETALYDAMASSLALINKSQLSKKILVVISDGGDNASKNKLARVVAMAKQSNVIIYCIGVYDDTDPDMRPDVLKHFADDTGGRAYFPLSVTALDAICEQIARDIRNQYMIAYTPSNGVWSGAYRSIRLSVRGGLTARTRSGYYATQQPLTTNDSSRP